MAKATRTVWRPISNNRDMKARTVRLSLVTMLIFVLVCTCAVMQANAAPAFEPERSSYWHERSSFFHTFAREVQVVMVGDSLTDGAEWREMFADQDIVNRGIDGDTTDGVLARLDDILDIKPKRVFIMIGINDFAEAGRSVDDVFANYSAIVSGLVRRGVKVFVQSTLPCNEAKGAWKSCAGLNPRIGQLNARLAGLASANVTFIDLVPVLTAKGSLKNEFTYDGVHLNGEGYRQWKNAIAPYMPTASKTGHWTP